MMKTFDVISNLIGLNQVVITSYHIPCQSNIKSISFVFFLNAIKFKQLVSEKIISLLIVIKPALIFFKKTVEIRESVVVLSF